jgi:hypothetical protein
MLEESSKLTGRGVVQFTRMNSQHVGQLVFALNCRLQPLSSSGVLQIDLLSFGFREAPLFV